MNYASLTKTIERKVLAAMALINNPEIEPAIRQLNQEILLREVGTAVYDKVYDMNAYDFEIPHTKGSGIDDRFYGLAKVASGSVSAGKEGQAEYVKNYLDNMAGKAQKDSFTNAKESGSKPRVKRIADSNACKWCRSLAGEYTDPPPDVFKRHGGCNCEIRTEGYKSRNGLLKNYTKDTTPRNSAPATDFSSPKTAEQAFNLSKIQGMGLKDRNKYVENYLEKASPTISNMAKDWDFTLQFQTFDHLKWEDAADQNLIAKYVADFKKGDKFPPPIAFNFSTTNSAGGTTNNFTIVDGRHRVEALRQLGATGVPVLVGDIKGRFDLASLGL